MSNINSNTVVRRRNGSVVPLGIFSPGKKKIWMDDLDCNGTEESLVDCKRSDWGENDCSHVEDVSITCEPNPLAGMQISA